MNNIGEKIRYERLKKRLKQYELAEKSGISNTFLSDIEVGRTMPSIKTMKKIAEVLEVSIKDFLD